MARTLDREARRAEIVSAATAAFAERGIAHTAVSDIVKAAGVAQGTFYLYFTSKDDVVVAVAERIGDVMVDGIERVVAVPDLSAVDKFFALLGTLRRERSVLGSLMTRCPLTRKSVPRTRRRPLVRSTSDQRRAQRLTPAQARGGEQPQQWRISDLGNGDVVPSCPRHTCRLTLAAGSLAYGNWARPGSSGDRASRGRSANVPLMATISAQGSPSRRMS